MKLPLVNTRKVEKFINKSEESTSTKKPKRTENRSIFFTKDELTRLKQAAENQGMPLATFIRTSALKRASEI